MGRASRQRPQRLAEKLRQIRNAYGLSQDDIASRLAVEGELNRNYISGFERGTREPPLPVLLRYARLAGVYVDALIDDSVDLPDHLPASSKYKWALRHP